MKEDASPCEGTDSIKVPAREHVDGRELQLFLSLRHVPRSYGVLPALPFMGLKRMPDPQGTAKRSRDSLLPLEAG